MAREVINIGTSANDHTGDPPRTAYAKINRMTAELYAAPDAAAAAEASATAAANSAVAAAASASSASASASSATTSASTATTQAAAAEASATLAAAYANSNAKALILIVHGQSNDIPRASRVTETATSVLLMPQGGDELSVFANLTNVSSQAQQSSNYDTFVPWVGSSTKEGHLPGMAYHLQNVGYRAILGFHSGYGGMSYNQVRFGSIFGNNAEIYAAGAYRWLINAGYDHANIDWLLYNGQAEADVDLSSDNTNSAELAVTAVERKAQNTYWGTALQAMITRVTGRTATNAKVLIRQLLSNYYGAGARAAQTGDVNSIGTVPGVWIHQPHTQFWPSNDEGDLIHIVGAGKRKAAEVSGMIARRILDGRGWTPLYMLSATRSSTTVTVTFNKPIKSDTSSVTEATAYTNSKWGVEFYDGSSPINITGGSISGSVLTLTLAGTPSGTEKVRNAMQTYPGSGNYSTRGARSNIAAVTTLDTLEDGTVAQDFAIPQEISVT